MAFLYDLLKLEEENQVAVTCAVAVFVPSGKVLLVHPTGAGYFNAWSLPKGIKDKGEGKIEAAARELWEETGLEVDKFELKDHGVFDYLAKKRYHLFSVQWKEEIDVKKLKCTTTFSRNGKEEVEVDKFMLASFSDAVKFLNKKQAAIFESTFRV